MRKAARSTVSFFMLLLLRLKDQRNRYIGSTRSGAVFLVTQT